MGVSDVALSRSPHADARFSGSPKTPGRVAQLAEHSTLNRLVVGSIPTASTIHPPCNKSFIKVNGARKAHRAFPLSVKVPSSLGTVRTQLTVGSTRLHRLQFEMFIRSSQPDDSGSGGKSLCRSYKSKMDAQPDSQASPVGLVGRRLVRCWRSCIF
jgi:hypothetical protein